MDNESLVELVRSEPAFLHFKAPRDERVLESMLKVDRADFLPKMIWENFLVEAELFGTLYHIFATSEKSGGTSKTDIDNLLARIEKFSPNWAGAIRKEILSFQSTDYKNILLHLLNLTLHTVLKQFEEGPPYAIPLHALAYSDRPLPIGYDQTCSQPSIVAFMADILELQPGMRVLEIGSGCGYMAAIVSHMIEKKRMLGRNGYLVSIERIPTLAAMASRHLSQHFGEKEMGKRIRVVEGDGKIGFPDCAPYDRIYFTAAVLPGYDPATLVPQLHSRGGIILYPKQDSMHQSGELVKHVYRDGIILTTQNYPGVSFVPLL